MEQDDLVPFSKLISSMLLVKSKLTPMDIVNVMSGLESIGIDIDDYNDSIDCLSCCVKMNGDCSFSLTKEYSSMLDDKMTVRDFLLVNSDYRIVSFFEKRVLEQENDEIGKILNIKSTDKKRRKVKVIAVM